jgi:hypothetical protein
VCVRLILRSVISVLGVLTSFGHFLMITGRTALLPGVRFLREVLMR